MSDYSSSAVYLRHTKPELGNKFYTKSGWGNGISTNVLGNNKSWNGSDNPYTKDDCWRGCTLPNCVGLVNGAFNETISYVRNEDKIHYNIYYNCGENYTKVSKELKRLPRGVTPTIGSVMCWSDFNGGPGHVAFVYDVKEIDGEILVYTFESDWGHGTGNLCETRIRHLGKDGNWPINPRETYGQYYQGCIKNPEVKDDAPYGSIKKPNCNIGLKVAVPKIYDQDKGIWLTATPCIRYDGGWYKLYNTGTEKVEDKI